ncbi:Rrf2 family transcriptional regulator [Catellatospora sp. TT07R-123]|uniref:Rrf2 family transcriptional regulator n=1 Tax=Catellatospora sp. TT07R-123 TaxID=2733863 RepID=UPI001BB4319C|nr:Rrf2 family transcriptional regulator [Catellatospora sp. TT07R-123]
MALLRRDRQPLDDDQIARAIPMNRHYVNQICRQLATEGVVTRDRGADGRLVNWFVGREPGVAAEVRPALAAPETPPPRLRVRSYGLMDGNVEQLIADFADCVTLFERQRAFPGPSLYFHERAIERQRRHATVSSLLDDDRLLEYVYAVLPAWGMHRMGAQRAKVGDFAQIVSALREVAPVLETLWPLRITGLQARQVDEVTANVWKVITRIKVSTSGTQIVAGSKFLHHLLPDLVPPIDRQYTFRFFAGRKTIPSHRAAFLVWFPRLVEIASRCSTPNQDAISRGGFMATGQAKVIDNAIIGFMQRYRRQPRPT